MVKAAGYEFVIRYCGQPTNPKDVTPAEVADMLANHVAVALVFESTASRASEGFDAGSADARAALAHQAALGIPPSRPVYFAVDYDADPAVVEPYFRGVQSVAGHDGVYGSARVVQRLLDDHLAVTGWQTVAWSRGQLAPGRALFQRLGTVVVDAVECDVSESLLADFGQYPAPIPPLREDTPIYLKCQRPDGSVMVATTTPYFVGIASDGELKSAEANIAAGAYCQWVELATWNEYQRLRDLQMAATDPTTVAKAVADALGQSLSISGSLAVHGGTASS